MKEWKKWVVEQKNNKKKKEMVTCMVAVKLLLGGSSAKVKFFEVCNQSYLLLFSIALKLSEAQAILYH